MSRNRRARRDCKRNGIGGGSMEKEFNPKIDPFVIVEAAKEAGNPTMIEVKEKMEFGDYAQTQTLRVFIDGERKEHFPDKDGDI